ncbi:asparagine synthase (glutamine-hydrolyzing) [Haloarcula sp. JP-L23]|uniref:asparagine synthase (glutamine-hydrolyzing) n=1 Tax=Haloarcula sp. JP-L23 TaxID=2716717 RepID=UPI00140EB00C|nr:asparagine synthase (glutamine-hydrolyzing) [Haloarcula sp. JP-L23]
MCGIAGVYGWVDENRLDEMLACIRHRGPDEGGRHVDERAGVMLGMRRLSIVDLAGGSQPIYNEDDTVAVVFNGEIYNRDSLRAELESSGHTFTTDSDTEVLVHGWEEWGQSLPERLNGMFAFAVYDEADESVFLARDRVGIKPLYVATVDDGLAFASELRQLLRAGVSRDVDPRAVHNFFSVRYTPGSETLLSAVEKVEPGTSLLVTDDGVERRRYWELSPSPVTGTRDAIADRIRDLLDTSVQRRLMADVPVGAFLSGGLDSSAIVGLANEHYDGDLQTFSVGFQQAEADESEEARFVADHFGTDHHELTVDIDDMDVFSDLVAHYGEPLADAAALPTMLVSAYAADEVKCVLTGEGADELFAGYHRHRLLPKHRQYARYLPRFAFDAADAVSEYTGPLRRPVRYAASLESDRRAILESARRYDDERPETYLETDHDTESSGLTEKVETATARANDDTLQRLTAYDISYWLPDDLLYKVDRASMAASLEARVPFLDHELVEYAYNVPSDYKLAGYKRALTDAVDDVVPARILERDKHGFNVPVSEWFRRDHDAIAGWLTEAYVGATPYLDTDAVFALRRAHRRGNADHGMTLWKVLTYVAWYDEFVRAD